MRRVLALAVIATCAAVRPAAADLGTHLAAARIDAAVPAAAGAHDERADRVDAPPASRRPRRPPSALRRAAGVAAAIVPGFVLRGAGSYVAGERRTAKRLFAAGGLGLAVAALGGLAVGGTRGSEYFVWPGIPITLAGAGVFLPTWFADLWVAAGGERVRGGPRGAPPWSLELGTTWQHGAYHDRAYAGAAARVELGRVGLGAGLLADAGGDARTADLDLRVRLLGAPATGAPIAEGSRLAVRAGGRYHRDDADALSLATAELELLARVELRHLDALLAGMFLDLTTGLGVERAGYPGGIHELGSLLLGRFAWGAYLGRRGEVTIFYDHRRDHLAGGLYTSRASGFNGSFGAAATALVAGPWAVRAELEAGAAWVSTLALRYHGGPR